MPDNNFAKDIRWDLSDLYASIDDPKIDADLKLTLSKAQDFTKKYRPLIEALDVSGANILLELLKDLKELATITRKLGTFAHLQFAEKTNDPKSGAFMQKIQVELTEIQSYLIFFEIYWNKVSPQIAETILADKRLAQDRHLLEKMRAFAPYTLNEGEEKIMSIKSNTSGSAFGRLFDEVMNSIPFYIETNGERLKKTEGEILSYLHSSDRAVRKKASESLAEGLSANTHLLTYIYNMILADHRSDLKIRNYKHPSDAMNLSNEIELEGVMNLIRAVKSSYPLAQKYHRLKGRLIGLEKLYDYDRYAPVDNSDDKIDFTECKRIVLEGYYAFSNDTGKIAERFFNERWIDAEIREGKQGGGFCCQTTPDLHPYILVNYTGSLRDVMTVAHELGHGIHQYLAGKKVGVLESDAPLTMAETASVFGEMLIFDSILNKEKDPKKRLALLCGKIDDNFATVYRQIVLTDFELRAHETGLKDGELSEEVLNGLWMQVNREFYNDSVELTENYRHGWKYIPHFVHSPFYCYAYSFAQLFVLSLYQKYKEDRQTFIPQYLEMLSLGGSKKPKEIAAIAGLDIRDSGFWNSGIKLLENLVREAEDLA